MGCTLGLLPEDGFQLIVAGALLSITINPFLFRLIPPLEHGLRDAARHRGPHGAAGRRARPPARPRNSEGLRQHAIICGYGRVGRLIGPALERRGFRYVVITQQRDEVDRLRARGVPADLRRRVQSDVLEMARVHTRAAGRRGDLRAERDAAHRRARPGTQARASTSSSGPTATPRRRNCARSGAKVQVVHGERELAVQMARYALRRFGVSATEAEAIAQGLRGRSRRPGQRRVRVGRWWSGRASRRSGRRLGRPTAVQRPTSVMPVMRA